MSTIEQMVWEVSAGELTPQKLLDAVNAREVAVQKQFAECRLERDQLRDRHRMLSHMLNEELTDKADRAHTESIVSTDLATSPDRLFIGNVEWRCVPINPTPEMIAAGLSSWDSGMTPPGGDVDGALIAGEYRAMVLAAPEVLT